MNVINVETVHFDEIPVRSGTNGYRDGERGVGCGKRPMLASRFAHQFTLVQREKLVQFSSGKRHNGRRFGLIVGSLFGKALCHKLNKLVGLFRKTALVVVKFERNAVLAVLALVEIGDKAGYVFNHILLAVSHGKA